MITAKVHRPAFEAGKDHPSVTLTATVTHGSVTKEFDLPLKVKMQGITDSQSVVLDLTDIVIPNEITGNITLATLGKNGSTITWESNGSAISNTGVVTRPVSGSTDATVTLTATAKKGSEVQTKDFTVVVKAWTTTEEIDEAVKLVNWELIKGTNNNSQAITDNLVLPATVGRSVAATWSTASSCLNAATGVITRPSYTTGPVTLNITCVLNLSGLERTVVMDPFIVATLPITNAEAVAAAKTQLEPSMFLGTNVSINSITDDMQLPYRVSDVNASIATIAWSLADASHVAISTSPYVSLSNYADYCLADINRPSSTAGNIKLALKAEISAGDSTSKVTDTKYFDITILVA